MIILYILIIIANLYQLLSRGWTLLQVLLFIHLFNFQNNCQRYILLLSYFIAKKIEATSDNDDSHKMWLSWNRQWDFGAQRIPAHFAKGVHNNHVLTLCIVKNIDSWAPSSEILIHYIEIRAHKFALLIYFPMMLMLWFMDKSLSSSNLSYIISIVG